MFGEKGEGTHQPHRMRSTHRKSMVILLGLSAGQRRQRGCRRPLLPGKGSAGNLVNGAISVGNGVWDRAAARALRIAFVRIAHNDEREQ